MQLTRSATRLFSPSAMCLVLIAWLSDGLVTPGHAQQGQGTAAAAKADGGAVTLFQNVRIFDGTGEHPYLGEVLVQGNRIKQ